MKAVSTAIFEILSMVFFAGLILIIVLPLSDDEERELHFGGKQPLRDDAAVLLYVFTVMTIFLSGFFLSRTRKMKTAVAGVYAGCLTFVYIVSLASIVLMEYFIDKGVGRDRNPENLANILTAFAGISVLSVFILFLLSRLRNRDDKKLKSYLSVCAATLIIVSLTLSPIIYHFIFPEKKAAGGEAAPVSALRTISSAQELYNTRYGRYGTLEELGAAGMVDDVLARATRPESPKTGLYFSISISENGLEWSLTARPAIWGETGIANFRTDQSGVIYINKYRNPDEGSWERLGGGGG